MHANRKAVLAASLLAGAALLTGCTADTRPAATSTPEAAQQQTAAPEETGKTAEETTEKATEEATEETQRTLTLQVDGQKTEEAAVRESGKLLLPLEETGRALGWKADSRKTQRETQTDCEITLEKDDSRITVSYEVSDNTIRKISWQKDGLLIPVDTDIETFGGVVYVPAAFFEEAMNVRISEGENSVEISSPEPMDTPQTNQ